jgi:c-di-GMP-binding flagellar brake protein YcgR
MDERRRYFRIEDTIAVLYEPLGDEQAKARQEAINRGDFGPNNSLQETERQLQLLIDKLRVQNPELGEAVELLNTKFNLLKNDVDESAREMKVVRASISACGVSFKAPERMPAGEMVYLDILLLPTDLHVQTVADVVACRELEGESAYEVSFEFNHLSLEVEELMIQHVVKRQGRLLAEKRQNSS